MQNRFPGSIKRRHATVLVAALMLAPAAAWSYTFTTCGATGPNGPAQGACDTAYTSTDLDGDVTVTGGIQSWTVPVTGTYSITATGAQGAAGEASVVGGLGTEISGEFELTAGTTLLQKNQSAVLVDGDSVTGNYGNKLEVSSSGPLKTE